MCHSCQQARSRHTETDVQGFAKLTSPWWLLPIGRKVRGIRGFNWSSNRIPHRGRSNLDGKRLLYAKGKRWASNCQVQVVNLEGARRGEGRAKKSGALGARARLVALRLDAHFLIGLLSYVNCRAMPNEEASMR